MKYLLFLLGFVSFAQTATLESFGGQANNTSFNNATAYQNAINANIAGNLDKLILTGGAVYNFDTTINNNGAENLIIESSNTTRAEFFSDNLVTILKNTTNSHDITYNYIKVNSTYSDGDSGAGNNNALFYLSESAPNIYNYFFHQVEMTCPNSNTNGIKLYVQNGETFRGLTVTDSYFHDLGRMGVETVNHDPPKPTTRVYDVTVTGSTFENTGLSPVGYGMGVSLSGRTDGFLLENNVFVNNKTTAVELIGVINGTVRNNNMSGVGSPVHIVNGDGINNEDILVENNEADTSNGLVIQQSLRLIFRNNIFQSATRNYINGMANSSFTNDYFSSNNIAVFQFPSSTNPITNYNNVMNNVRLEKNGGTILQVGTSGSLTLNGVELYNTSSTFTESNVSYNNVGNWLNDVYQGSQGGDINSYAPRFSYVGNTEDEEVAGPYTPVVKGQSAMYFLKWINN